MIGRIRAGEVYQLNLCTRLTGDLLDDPARALRADGRPRLRPAYGALLPTGPDRPGEPQPGAVPHRRRRSVITSPIKGTTKRSEDPDGSLLRSSAKDAAENIMITDLMRNDLSRVCAPGSVAVTGLLEVQPHPGVWHLVSTVTGRAAPRGHGPADLLAATFPPGSVTGAPKSSASPGDRRRGAAAPGGLHRRRRSDHPADGRAELSVLIRTFEIAGSASSSGSAAASRWTACPSASGASACTRPSRSRRAAGSRSGRTVWMTGPPASPTWLARATVCSRASSPEHGRPLRLADHLARLARSVRELYGLDLPDGLAARVAAVGSDHPRRSGRAPGAVPPSRLAIPRSR